MKEADIIEVLSPYEEKVCRGEIDKLPNSHYQAIEQSYREMLLQISQE